MHRGSVKVPMADIITVCDGTLEELTIQEEKPKISKNYLIYNKVVLCKISLYL